MARECDPWTVEARWMYATMCSIPLRVPARMTGSGIGWVTDAGTWAESVSAYHGETDASPTEASHESQTEWGQIAAAGSVC